MRWTLRAVGGRTRLELALRLLVLAVAAAALVDFFVAYPSAFRNTRDAFRTQHATARSDRELAAAFNYDVSRAFVVEAKTLLPAGARYAFVTGPHNGASMPTTVTAAPFVTRYLLMPRHMVQLGEARWLLCYGCDPGALHRRVDVVWREPDSTGLLIARVRG